MGDRIAHINTSTESHVKLNRIRIRMLARTEDALFIKHEPNKYLVFTFINMPHLETALSFSVRRL
jgi:hypothetical protein